MADELYKFLFEGLPVRGMLVRLDAGWREALQRRVAVGAFPPPVRALLGEMAAAGVLMQASIKFDGALVLQVFGDGPVKLAVAEVQPDLAFRATAKVVGEVDDAAQLEAMVNVHGHGRCAITLVAAGPPQGDSATRGPTPEASRGPTAPLDKSDGRQPYLGVVALHGDAREPLQQLSQVLEHYMLQSEQLDTRLILAADDTVAAGLLIQRMPVEGAGNLPAARREDEIGINEAFRQRRAVPKRPELPSGEASEASWGSSFNRIALLAATLTRNELLALDAETLLRRLFWEDDLRRFEPMHPRFACNCSRERVRNMLRSLGQPEVDGIVVERGAVEIGCDFCGLQYRFDAVDVGAIFVREAEQPPGSNAVQ